MLVIVLLALFAQLLSGAAAIVNQTVWQRSLIVHFAGSEAVSSMIVVLAFMAGLGAGALWIGRTADRIRNPARAVRSFPVPTMNPRGCRLITTTVT